MHCALNQWRAIQPAIYALSSLCLLHSTLAQAQEAKPKLSPQEELFVPVAAKWKTAQATFLSVASDRDYSHLSSKWAGKFWGVIRLNSSFEFRAGNGCIFSGTASRIVNGNQWLLNGRLEYCSVSHFNGAATGNVYKEGNGLRIEIEGRPFEVGRPPVRYTIEANLQAYE